MFKYTKYTITHNPDSLDLYVSIPPMSGDAFTIDAVEARTIFVTFTTENGTEEAKIQGHSNIYNGC